MNIKHAILIAIFMSAAACSPTSTLKPTITANNIVSQSRSTADICSEFISATGLRLLQLEAELGSRNSLICETAQGQKGYVGKTTFLAVGQRTYARNINQIVSSNTKNCSDFSNSSEAQRFFLQSGGPSRDPHNLDADGDGNACEWGTMLQTGQSNYQSSIRQNIARTSTIRPVTTSRPTRSSHCFVGPRGGRYTITASGNKNYGGC